MSNKITKEEREKIQDRADMMFSFFKIKDVIEDLISTFSISKDRATRHAARAARRNNKR